MSIYDNFRQEEVLITSYFDSVKPTQNYVAELIALPVDTDSMSVRVMSLGDELYDLPVGTERAPNAPYIETKIQASYELKELKRHSHSTPIDFQLEGGEKCVFGEENIAAFLKNEADLELEYAVSSLLTTAGTYHASNRHQVTDHWTAGSATATPIAEINDGFSRVEDCIGLPPNIILIGIKPWHQLKGIDEIREILASNQTQIMTPEILAAYFDVETVVIGSAKYRDPVTGTLVNCWDDCVIVGRAANSGFDKALANIYQKPYIAESFIRPDTTSRVYTVDQFYLVDAPSTLYGYYIYDCVD